MKNTFATSMTLLLALTLGASYGAYRVGTHHPETAPVLSTGEKKAEAEAEAPAAETPPANTPSPTAEGGKEGTMVGQTGASPTETASAANESINDAKAAEIAGQTEGNVQAGKEKFDATCQGCHGAAGAGGFGPAMTKEANKWSIDEIMAAVRTGKTPTRELAPTMPRHTPEMLNDGDLKNIAAYVKSLE